MTPREALADPERAAAQGERILLGRVSLARALDVAPEVIDEMAAAGLPTARGRFDLVTARAWLVAKVTEGEAPPKRAA